MKKLTKPRAKFGKRKPNEQIFIRIQNIVDLDKVRPGIECMITHQLGGQVKVWMQVVRLREKFQIK